MFSGHRYLCSSITMFPCPIFHILLRCSPARYQLAQYDKRDQVCSMGSLVHMVSIINYNLYDFAVNVMNLGSMQHLRCN